MTTPADYPTTVAPGELITSAWGNKVAQAFTMKRPWVTLQRPNFGRAAPGSAEVLVTLTGLTGVVDPATLIVTNGLEIPAVWAGLWNVSYSLKISGSINMVASAYVKVGAVASNVKAGAVRDTGFADMVGAGSDVVVIPPAGALISLYCLPGYTGTFATGIDLALTASYIGPGL